MERDNGEGDMFAEGGPNSDGVSCYQSGNTGISQPTGVEENCYTTTLYRWTTPASVGEAAEGARG